MESNGATGSIAKVVGPRSPTEAQDLENTGERFLPGAMYSAEVAYDHFARYRLAERYLAGKNVIEMGCGAGYGTNSLSKVTESIVGVDLSEEAIAFAASRYEAPNLRYEVGDVAHLPYEDGSFEAAVSFEVIEHLPNPEDLVLEARRLVGDDGLFVVSTPDKKTYSNDRNSVNPHHLKEMYTLEFKEMLERSFEHVRLYRQGALAGSIISPHHEELPEDGTVELESAQFSLPDLAFGRGLPTTLYVVAVCANGGPPEPLERPIMTLDRDRQVYEEHGDWRNTVAQMRGYYNFRQGERLRETNERHEQRQERLNAQLREVTARLQEARREMEALQGTRGWKVATGLHLAVARARGILGRG